MEVGQKVWLEPLGNAARYNKNIREGVISKIGRKYFEVDGYGKFELNSKLQVSDFTPNYRVFLSEQDITIEMERRELRNKLSEFFRSPQKLTIEQMRQINEIIANP